MEQEDVIVAVGVNHPLRIPFSVTDVNTCVYICVCTICLCKYVLKLATYSVGNVDVM